MSTTEVSNLEANMEITNMEVANMEVTNMEVANMEVTTMEVASPFQKNMEVASPFHKNMEVASPFQKNMEVASDTEQFSTDLTPPDGRRRRKKSMVWEHFTIETVSTGCRRACCKGCKQTFVYSTGSKVAGTSHLKRHIALGSCPEIKSQERRQQALAAASDTGVPTEPPKKRYRAFSSYLFDQERSSANLAKMIILHEYPLHIVEQPAFISFVQSLQPRFEMIGCNALEQEVLVIYEKEKQNLMQIIEVIPGRISLSISLWTTNQSLGYVSLSGQFIDSEWKLHRRVLNFIRVSSPHSENALSGAIDACLSDWNLKTRLFTITLDNNCSSHDIYSANLRDHLSNKNTLMLKGQLFVVRCYAHILNVVALDALASIHGIIYNIRESIKYVKASPAREEKFGEIVQQLQIIQATSSLSLDVLTQWNTTYHMLVAALEFRQAFISLESSDDNYNEAPSLDDWRKVEIVCIYLKLLIDSAESIISTVDATANIFFQEAWKILLELTNALASEEIIVSSIAKQMHEKFDKYWKDCSLVLAIAVIMDPRFKMKLVEFSFTKIYGEDAAAGYIKMVNDRVHELFFEYVAHPLLLGPTYVEQSEGSTTNPTVRPPVQDGLSDFDKYLSEIASDHDTKSELDQYLEESLVPRIPEFDILNWWKLNGLKYPMLSMMARDVLAIPMSMVSSGSIFGQGNASRALDDYRSSLHPETVESLFCLKDWLQYVPTMVEPP